MYLMSQNLEVKQTHLMLCVRRILWIRHLFYNFLFSVLYFKDIFIYFSEREWVGMRRGEGFVVVEGQRERESQADSMLCAQPDMGLNLTILRSWPEPQSSVRWLIEPPRCPWFTFLKINCSKFWIWVFIMFFLNSYNFLKWVDKVC